MTELQDGTLNQQSGQVGSPPPSQSLTERMRHASKDRHDQSDKLVNLKLSLILTSKILYAEAISLFWPIYIELERIMEVHKDHPQLGQLYDFLPMLRRAPSFEKDMAYLMGDEILATQLQKRRIIVDEGVERLSPPELGNYIDHLRRLSKNDPLLLLPYVYSMYSAILAGGSIIKRTVKAAFSLKTDSGVEMFIMPLEGTKYRNITEFRTAFRRTIDKMEETILEDDQIRIVQEAPHVFIRNNALVATARDTDAFRTVWAKVLQSIGFISAIGVVLLSVWMYPRSG